MSASVTNVARAAAAGCAATLPMTLVMEGIRRLLPRHEQYTLPPREVTERVAEQVGFEPHLGETERNVLTAASHFAYGAAMGGIYGAVGDLMPLPPIARGALFGLGVWAANYLGLLPALGILTPATQHPPRRNAMMIVSHLVWGGTLGALADGRR